MLQSLFTYLLVAHSVVHWEKLLSGSYTLCTTAETLPSSEFFLRVAVVLC